MTIQNIEAEPHDRSKIVADSEHGVVGSWWQLAIGMTEASWGFGFGIVQDSRVEIRRRVDATLTFAEEMGVGGFRYARKVVDRLDRISAEVLGRGEATAMVVTRMLRRTGHGVTDLATNTLTDAIGTSQPHRKADGARAPAVA